MIWLARHGQTGMNAQGRYQGRIDRPLNAHGRAQAAAVGRILSERVDPARAIVFASPLLRAQETARVIARALGRRHATDPRLVEVAMGQWEGLTAAEIDAGWPGARNRSVRNGWFFEAPGGEGYDGVAARLGSLLADLARGPRMRADPEVVLVSHAVTGRVLRGLWAGLEPPAAFRLEIPQDAVFALRPGGGVERVPPLAQDRLAPGELEAGALEPGEREPGEPAPGHLAHGPGGVARTR